MDNKRVIFVPGKNPKPPCDRHTELLWRCLLNGVEKHSAETANDMRAKDNFEVACWNHLYYRQRKGYAHELRWIERLLQKPEADANDIRQAIDWRKQVTRYSYELMDRFPGLLHVLPVKSARATVHETLRYFENHDDIACRIRDILKHQIRQAIQRGERILLIGHSMGAIIAWDSLWELTHLENRDETVDCLLTLGSPLGMRFVQHQLLGARQDETKRYPAINRWINIASQGDLVALDKTVEDDFQTAVKRGMIREIKDVHQTVYNYYRNEQGLNVHRSYGYLVNPVVGKVVANWWNGENHEEPTTKNTATRLWRNGPRHGLSAGSKLRDLNS